MKFTEKKKKIKKKIKNRMSSASVQYGSNRIESDFSV